MSSLMSNLTNEAAVANQGEAMGADTISTNGTSSKIQTSRGNRFLFLQMKKFFLILVAIVCFGISANAQVVFRSKQTVCLPDKVERMEFFSSGKVFWYSSNDLLLMEGTYTITNGHKGIRITFDRMQPINVQANISGSTLNSIIYNRKAWNKCSR